MTQSTFVQVPPQSTGKKVATRAMTELPYDNKVGTFEAGDTVTGAISGASGVVAGQDNTELFLRQVVGTFTDNEALQVNAVTIANANVPPGSGQVDFDIQKVTIADPDNPEYIQKIDRFGATVNTFTDGSPVFGAFGTLTTGEPKISRVYRFAADIEPNEWSNETTGTATVTWDGAKTACLHTTGTDIGDAVKRTTNYYHPYIPGVGLNVEMTIQIGDTGKAGCTRRWGYYDDFDGFFFELEGTDFYVVKRDSTSGTPIETRIIQEDFNRDEVNGTDSTNFTLDLSKGNMFWIDIQWYGAGRLRYGIYEPGGTRVTMHEIQHSNTSVTYPFSRTATLPVRFEQFNTGATAGTSQMLNTGSIVKHAHEAEVTGGKHTDNSGIKTATVGSEIPVFSMRPKTTVNGYPNRSIIKAQSIGLSNIPNTGNGVVLFRVRAGTDAALTGSTFDVHSGTSITEVDTAASAVNTGLTHVLASWLVSPGQSFYQRDIDPRSLPTYELYLNADGVTQPCLIVTAECLNGTSADVIALANWEEIKY